ncbi:hypothetical protein [Psychrobacter sp. P11G5]|uniref:hypothetical protein n=1 Tax=Psychrobacter sp. P11G5 TaxID=1699624 RepID=UPI00078DECA0|nr:hypothetical protein [Psychrobacter sp. P11G5]AMN66542.1 hypothetical protein AK825_01375 [Psychrobacter sp. P11G5]
MKKTVLNTALSTAFIVTLGFGITACSSDKEGESHEVMAVDRVDEAAELARKNAPEAEDMEFPETAPMPVTGVDGAETEGAATAEAATTDTAMAETTATDSANTDAAVADSAGMPAADTTATTTPAEPATN